MARVDCSGAERASTIELDSTTVVGIGASFGSVTTQARSGSRSWEAHLGVSAVILDTAYGTMTLPSTQSHMCVFFSLYIDSGGINIGGQPQILSGKGGALGVEVMSLDSDMNAGDFDLTLTRVATVGGVSVSVNGLEYDRWHNIQVRMNMANGNAGHLRVNGTEVSTTTNNAAATDFRELDFGIVSQGGVTINVGTDIYIDDIIVDSVGTDTNQIADASFLSYHPPNGDVTSNWNTNGAGASHTARITDDVNSTDIRVSNASTAIDEFSMSNISGTLPSLHTEIIAVYGSTVNGSGLGAPGNYTYRYVEGANLGVATTITTDTGGNTLNRSCHIATSAPDGGDWNVTKLNNSNMRLTAATNFAQAVLIPESWNYAEIQVAIGEDDTIPVTEEVTEVNVIAAIEDTIPVTEETDVFVTTSIEDTAALAEELSVFAIVDLEDTSAVTEEADQVTFIREDLCSGSTVRPVFNVFD